MNQALIGDAIAAWLVCCDELTDANEKKYLKLVDQLDEDEKIEFHRRTLDHP